ncbi:putative nuclease HARBI1 [Folsomia candida]|nr:putative nuclease HARBI1 [Folsomia candida]
MSLNPREQILLALHWMGNGEPYHGLGDMHGVSKSTVCRVVDRVVTVTVNHFLQDVVRWPDDTSAIAPEFLRIGGFPSVCGCIDGSLIKIDSPPVNEEQYVDRNGNHSLNLMGICGPDHSFYFVSCRWPGSVHDARVLRRSSVTDRFTNGWRPFPGAVILGDSAYPLKSWLMPPIVEANNIPETIRYNRAHKGTRRLVECAYGIVKERFPCLNYMRLRPIVAAKVVMTCITSHNIASRDDFLVDLEINDDNMPNVENFPAERNGNERQQEFLRYFRR